MRRMTQDTTEEGGMMTHETRGGQFSGEAFALVVRAFGLGATAVDRGIGGDFPSRMDDLSFLLQCLRSLCGGAFQNEALAAQWFDCWSCHVRRAWIEGHADPARLELIGEDLGRRWHGTRGESMRGRVLYAWRAQQDECPMCDPYPELPRGKVYNAGTINNCWDCNQGGDDMR